jgi:hypothetical protein
MCCSEIVSKEFPNSGIFLPPVNIAILSNLEYFISLILGFIDDSVSMLNLIFVLSSLPTFQVTILPLSSRLK